MQAFFRLRSAAAGALLALVLSALQAVLPSALGANALETYVAAPDSEYGWTVVEDRSLDGGFTALRTRLTSQRWREHVWTHELLIVRPPRVRHSDAALLFITGDGYDAGYVELLKTLSHRAGATAALLTRVPNQPLYGGRKEDALIAYSFQQFIETGDESWPLLFPMVKSAVRAMDAMSEAADQRHGETLERFVLTGASKRGWTTWLTGAVDKRVCAIAPMVIDMLNMKPQLDWAERMWGDQSRQIHDYTDIELHKNIDEPPVVRLREWVDPYSYADRYTMPKLILLGTNDPYWVVDSLRHYWRDLPEPKLLFQTPNAGHDLGGGKEASETLAAFFELVADRASLPKVEWTVEAAAEGKSRLVMRTEPAARAAHLWAAHSSDRDFRDNRWRRRNLSFQPSKSEIAADIEPPEKGFKAVMGEVEFETPSGHSYRLSTRVYVFPDQTATPAKASASAGTSPRRGGDRQFWIENMMLHEFDAEEMADVVDLSEEEILQEVRRIQRIPADRRTIQPSEGHLLALPYPGGRHPRIGFLEGAIRPQRDTKISVFAPWDGADYAVLDIPEALWSNLGLTYLAHTHIPTIWEGRNEELDPVEWRRTPDGGWIMERSLPNGIRFGARVEPRRDSLRLEEWLHNGTDETLTDLRVQNCVMLQGLDGFNQQSNDNKVLSKPYAACRSADGNRWVITAWAPADRAWANPPVPCLHSDPKFPDCPPGETRRLAGWFSFYEGSDIEGEFKRIEQTGWRDLPRKTR